MNNSIIFFNKTFYLAKLDDAMLMEFKGIYEDDLAQLSERGGNIDECTNNLDGINAEIKLRNLR